MKKILIILGLILITGCSNNKKIDLEEKGNELIETSILSNHEIGDIQTFSKRYDFKMDDIKEALIITSKSFDDASMVLMVLPNNGKSSSVKKEIGNFISSYENQWVGMNYFPEQKELVEDALNTVYNNYIIYIVSTDNDALLNIIKK